MIMRRKFCGLLFVLAFVHASLPNARAQLAVKIDEVIDKILARDDLQGTSSIVVGGFQLSVPQQDLHASSGIKQMFVDSLQRHHIKVERKGNVPAISGQYCYATANGAEIDIKLFVNDHEGASL